MTAIGQRFRGFYPVVIDLETGGFNATENALLELGAVLLDMDDDGLLRRGESFHRHVEIFPGLRCDAAALAFNGIDPSHPFRLAQSEQHVFTDLFQKIRSAQKKHQCSRSVLVGHNAWFDLAFMNAAIERNKIKRSPLHPFTSFDTASLGGLVCGQTVLAKACRTMGIAFDSNEAHSALYDAERTADLFCLMVNRWQQLGGWPPPLHDEPADQNDTENEGEGA